MKKSKIYTRSGDYGRTCLFGGIKILKSDLVIEAYGTIDELNSFIGLIISKYDLDKNHKEIEILQKIQNLIFVAGSEIASTKEFYKKLNLYINKKHIDYIEFLCDEYDQVLPDLKNFILPGGTEIASLFHCCRTICRRAERNLINLYKGVSHLDQIKIFLNRLSDYFFIMSRYDNFVNNEKENEWNKDLFI